MTLISLRGITEFMGSGSNLVNCAYLLANVIMLVMFAVPGIAASAPTEALILDHNFKQVSLNRHAGFLEDPSSELTIGDISSSSYEGEFTKVTEGVPNFGFTSSAYWVRLKLKSVLDEKTKFVLQIPYAAVDLIDVYIPQEDNSYTIRSAGDSVAFSSRQIEYPTLAFYLDIPADTEQSIYFRVKTTSSMQLPMVLWTTEAFTNRSSKEQLFWGLLFGTLFIAACYNLFLFFSVQDRVFLYYVLFVSSLVMAQLTLYGYSIQYFWPNHPALSNSALLIFLNLIVIFATFFCRHFLKLEEHAPRLNKVLNILCAYMIGGLVLTCFAPYSLVLKGFIIGLTIGAPLFIVSGIVCWQRGFPPARIYLFAWLVLVLGGVAYALKTWGYLPATVFSTYALPLGSLFEVVLFSIALGVRVKLQQKETYTARKAVMDMQNEVFKANQIALENARESDLMKQEFLATMSHELRTPMNGILGCCQLLDDREMSDEERITMDSLTDSARQMMGHVNRILNFSQLNEGKLTIDTSSFDLTDIVDDLKSNFTLCSEEKGLEFSIEIDPNVPRNLIGDKLKLLHILNDLVDNAVRFTEQGCVHVSFSKHTDANNDESTIPLCIGIRDTGIGVDEEARQTIFKMFSQKDGSFKRASGGLGLGLAICNKYVELMGGKIDFQSRPGIGTKIELHIPIKVADTPARSKADQLSEGDVHSEAKILVVEDNRTNQLIIKGMLKKLGYTVEIAANGEVAIALMEKNAFNLVLMDCQMPVMDGFETTQEIRKREWVHRDIPIIAVTANAMAGDRDHCLQVGMDDYLSKPVTKQSIKEKVDYWLGKKEPYIATGLFYSS